MALIICQECNKEISDKTNTCIHCGCPIEYPLKQENIKVNGHIINFDEIISNCGRDRRLAIKQLKKIAKISYNEAKEIINVEYSKRQIQKMTVWEEIKADFSNESPDNIKIEKIKMELIKLGLDIKRINKKVLNQLAETLSEGEFLKGFVLGIDSNHIYFSTLTNKKLIIINTILNVFDFIIESQNEILINKITSINQKNLGKIYGDIEIFEGTTSKVITGVKIKDINNFIKLINSEMENYKTIHINKTEIKQEDTYDEQISALNYLYKQGSLTDYEYSMKKQELLNKK